MLHTQLTKCIQTTKDVTPACANLLPQSASTFFSHYEHECNVAVSGLQSAINQLATQHIFDATIDAAEAAGDITTVARLRSITAPHASDWKAALPSSSYMILPDVYYRVAALFNLGLDIPNLPSDCHGCGGKDKLTNDPYHYLSCTQHKRKEITIGHNILVHTLYVYNNMTGGTAVKEPQDLHDDDGRRPDLQMITNNQHILTDVQITNPVCPSYKQGASRQKLYAAALSEKRKINKYTTTAALHHAAFIPFVMEATGGMSRSAQDIYERVVLASRDSGTLWPHEIIARDFRSSIAIAVQKRNAMTMIAGRCLAIGRAATSAAA